jgi:hypothetical protein
MKPTSIVVKTRKEMSTYESQHITDREVERATQLQECLDNDPDDYPEGGWRAWSVVLGAWCGMLPSFGLMNTMGIFEDWLSSHQLQAYSRSEVGWISSLYVSLLFLGSVQSGEALSRIPRCLQRI